MPAFYPIYSPTRLNAEPAVRPPTARHFAWLALGLFLLTAYGSVIPLRYHPKPLEEAVRRALDAPLIDFDQIGFWGDWAVNLVQYALLTFCFMACLAIDRRREVGLLAAALVIPAGWAVAFAGEVLQVYFPPRTVSRNDILVECLGVLAGATAWLLAGQALVNHARALLAQRGLAGLASRALPVYVALLVVVSAMPFDLIFGWDKLALKAREGRINLVPFTHLIDQPWVALDLAKALVAFAIFGALMALAPRWSGRGWQGALLAGVVVACGLELLHLVMFTRYFDVTDLLVGPAGAVLGFALARPLAQGRLRAPSPAACAALAAAWVVILVAVNWQPYHFSTNPADFRNSDPNLSDENTLTFGLRRMSWGPFVDYYWNTRYQALDQIMRRVLSFAPLGALLALAFRGRRLGTAVTVLLALIVAAVIEVGQYFIPERHSGVTDFVIHVTGAWLAYVVTRHVANALGLFGQPVEGALVDLPGPVPDEEGPPSVPELPELSPSILWHPSLGQPPLGHPPRPGRRRRRSSSKPVLSLNDWPYWVGAAIIGMVGLALLTVTLAFMHLIERAGP